MRGRYGLLNKTAVCGQYRDTVSSGMAEDYCCLVAKGLMKVIHIAHVTNNYDINISC